MDRDKNTVGGGADVNGCQPLTLKIYIIELTPNSTQPNLGTRI